MASVVLNQTADITWPSLSGKTAIGSVPGGRVAAKTDVATDYLENTKRIVDAVPVSSDTVSYGDTAYSQHLQIEPAGPLTDLEIVLPSDSNSVLGQELSLYANDDLGAITWSGAASILGVPATISSGEWLRLIKVGADKWARNG